MAVTFECSNEYFDEAGNSLGERISSSQNTVARYRFRDVSGAAPDPTLYEYIAHIQQAESIGEKNYFAGYSAYDGWQDQPGNYLAPVAGESSLKVEVIGDSIYVSFLILADRLPENYLPRTSCRIFIKEFTVVTLIRYLDIEFRESGTTYEAYFQQPEQLTNPVLTDSLFENDNTEFIYKFNDTNPITDGLYPNGWDDISPSNLGDWLGEMETETDHFYYVRPNVGGYVDTGLQIQYQSNGTPIDESISLPDDCIDLDAVIYMTRKVSVDSVVDSNGNIGTFFYSLRLDSPNVENYTIFDFDNLPALNAAINALVEDTKYAIHIFGLKDTNQSSSLDVTYTFLTDPTESKSIHVGSGINKEYRFFNPGGVSGTDNQCLRFGTNGDYIANTFAISPPPVDPMPPYVGDPLINLFDYDLNNPMTVIWWGRMRDQNDPQLNGNNVVTSILTPFTDQAGQLDGFYFIQGFANGTSTYLEMRYQSTTTIRKGIRFDVGTNLFDEMPYNSLVMCVCSYDGSELVSGMDLYLNGYKAQGNSRIVAYDDNVTDTRASLGRYLHGRLQQQGGPVLPETQTVPQCTERLQIYDAKLTDAEIRELFNNPNKTRDLADARLIKDIDFGYPGLDQDTPGDPGRTAPDLTEGAAGGPAGTNWRLGNGFSVPVVRNDFYEDLN